MLGLRPKLCVALGPTLLHPALLPPCPGVRDEQGVSSDKVLQHTVSVGTTQATAQQFDLASQCLLGQPPHVSHCRDRADRERDHCVPGTMSGHIGITTSNLHHDTITSFCKGRKWGTQRASCLARVTKEEVAELGWEPRQPGSRVYL